LKRRHPRAFDNGRRELGEGTFRILASFHLTLGHSPDALIATLAQVLLREDAGFHAYQVLEAGVRQCREWGNCAEIASRLMRGGELHRDAAQAR
jgi:hypothetical protein